MSDPPSNTDYSQVWVTVDGVEASVSTSDTGWEPLVSSLSSASGSIKAVQIDLLNLPANAADPSSNCLLALLGSTQSLPAGNYQQIRLMLVPNNATNVTLLSPSGEPTQNQCPSGWNCALPTGGTMQTLQLSSQAQTGLKIPPGQVMGGPISVTSGQSVDINLDFNADRSIVNEGGQLLLDPVLVAYQTNPINTSQISISGQIVEGTGSGAVTVTTTPIANANVALEMPATNLSTPDGTNTVDLIGNYLEQTDSNGNFYFCPMPAGNFDVVASAGPVTATSGSSTTYGATILTGVPIGTQQLSVPLLSQANGGGELQGTVTDSGVTAETTDDVYTLQQATSSLEFAVPFLSGSNPNMPQLCTGGSCTGNYDLFVPASNPVVGAFSLVSPISWEQFSSSNYKVMATCNENTVDTFGSSLTVSAGLNSSVPTLTLPSGCQ